VSVRRARRRTKSPVTQIAKPTITSTTDGFGPCERMGSNPSSKTGTPARMVSRPNKAATILESGRIRTMSNARPEWRGAKSAKMQTAAAIPRPL